MVEITREPGDYGKPENLIRIMEELNRLECKVGFFKSAQYNEEGLSVAEVVTQNEFGNPHQNIPPRPFMRPAVAEYSRHWVANIREGTRYILQGTETTKNLMQNVSMLAEGHIAKSLRNVTTPKLSVMTVQKRLEERGKNASRKAAMELINSGHKLAKPLIDTGLMLNSIHSMVQGESDSTETGDDI